jgi:hypothetical protein
VALVSGAGCMDGGLLHHLCAGALEKAPEQVVGSTSYISKGKN